MKKDQFSYRRHKKAIEAWLSNVTSVAYDLKAEGAMTRRAVKKLLSGLTAADSAFLTTDGEKLCVLVGKDQIRREKIYRFSKNPS